MRFCVVCVRVDFYVSILDNFIILNKTSINYTTYFFQTAPSRTYTSNNFSHVAINKFSHILCSCFSLYICIDIFPRRNQIKNIETKRIHNGRESTYIKWKNCNLRWLYFFSIPFLLLLSMYVHMYLINNIHLLCISLSVCCYIMCSTCVLCVWT